VSDLLRRFLDNVTVQIRKHLLHPLLAFVRKEKHGDGFVAESRTLFERVRNRSATVLSVVDDEFSLLEIHFKKSKPVGVKSLEPDIALVRGCN